MGKSRGGKYNIQKRDLEAVRVLTVIVDFPGCTRRFIADKLLMTEQRVGILVKYLDDYCEMIQIIRNPDNPRRGIKYYLKLPLTGKAQNFVRQSAILTTIVRAAGGHV